MDIVEMFDVSEAMATAQVALPGGGAAAMHGSRMAASSHSGCRRPSLAGFKMAK
jgi:hypothetical protein